MKLQFQEANGVRFLLRDDIWEFVEKRAYGKQVMQDDKLSNYPSELFSCKRKVFYRWIGIKTDERNFPGERIMDMGTLLHPYFGRIWSRAGFFLNEECHAATRNGNISFRPDYVGLIRTSRMAKLFHMKIGQIFVIDFKTISNRSYEYSKDGVTGIPKLDDEMQLQFYIGEIQKYVGKDMCPFGFLQYFSRDWAREFWNGKWYQKSLWNNDVALFQIPADSKKYKMGIKYFEEIQKAVEKKKIPKREGQNPEKYPCAYCEFSNYCWRK